MVIYHIFIELIWNYLNGIYLILIGVDWTKYRVDPKGKVVRAIYNRFYWVRNLGEDVEVNAIAKINMSFYIPNFVWNWLIGVGFNKMFSAMLNNLKQWLLKVIFIEKVLN